MSANTIRVQHRATKVVADILRLDYSPTLHQRLDLVSEAPASAESSPPAGEVEAPADEAAGAGEGGAPAEAQGAATDEQPPAEGGEAADEAAGEEPAATAPAPRKRRSR